jgi:hypothetical protein
VSFAPGCRTYMATTSVPRFVGSRRASTRPRRGTPLSSTTAESVAAAAGEGGGSTPYDGGDGGKKANRAATVDVTPPIWVRGPGLRRARARGPGTRRWSGAGGGGTHSVEVEEGGDAHGEVGFFLVEAFVEAAAIGGEKRNGVC